MLFCVRPVQVVLKVLARCGGTLCSLSTGETGQETQNSEPKISIGYMVNSKPVRIHSILPLRVPTKNSSNNYENNCYSSAFSFPQSRLKNVWRYKVLFHKDNIKY